MWLTISILLTAWAAPSSTAEEAATQQDQWFEDGWLGNYSPTPAEDSHVTAGATGKGGFHNVGGSYLLSAGHCKRSTKKDPEVRFPNTTY